MGCDRISMWLRNGGKANLLQLNEESHAQVSALASKHNSSLYREGWCKQSSETPVMEAQKGKQVAIVNIWTDFLENELGDPLVLRHFARAL